MRMHAGCGVWSCRSVLCCVPASHVIFVEQLLLPAVGGHPRVAAGWVCWHVSASAQSVHMYVLVLLCWPINYCRVCVCGLMRCCCHHNHCCLLLAPAAAPALALCRVACLLLPNQVNPSCLRPVTCLLALAPTTRTLVMGYTCCTEVGLSWLALSLLCCGAMLFAVLSAFLSRLYRLLRSGMCARCAMFVGVWAFWTSQSVVPAKFISGDICCCPQVRAAVLWLSCLEHVTEVAWAVFASVGESVWVTPAAASCTANFAWATLWRGHLNADLHETVCYLLGAVTAALRSFTRLCAADLMARLHPLLRTHTCAHVTRMHQPEWCCPLSCGMAPGLAAVVAWHKMCRMACLLVCWACCHAHLPLAGPLVWQW
ncbi:hypothetical protein COO60DRAFT_1156897 [Scenedesmus sp. NREL 46B-D3]|nr:hypothetical protein COO60DRAFT_1156897 [Scenedesmus sp. NREL 46B-D3]